MLEPRESELRIRGAPPPEEVLQWIRERRARLRANRARLGELADIDLEEEFEN